MKTTTHELRSTHGGWFRFLVNEFEAIVTHHDVSGWCSQKLTVTEARKLWATLKSEGFQEAKV